MDDKDWLAQRFEEHRTRLRAVAYRMLGSLPEADEAVQDAWLRLSRSGAEGVENLGGWLTTIVARVCLNLLQARKARPEQPAGLRMPDPVVTREGQADPEQEALLADSIGLALLVVLEMLDPAERLAFVLHDMFDLPFEEIAPMVGRSQRPRGSSRAEHAEGCRARQCRSIGMSLVNARLSTHSSPPAAPGTSTLSFGCCIPMSSCDRTFKEWASSAGPAVWLGWPWVAHGGPPPCSRYS